MTSSFEAFAQIGGGPEVARLVDVRGDGGVHRTGDMARDGIHRLDLAGEAFGGADIQEDSLGGELAGAVRFEHSEVAGRRREGAAAVRGTSVVTFPPPACHAASPPSSTRTSVSPKYRKIHQARAAA